MKNKDKKSRCCNAEIYEAPDYYASTMKTHAGEPIPMITVCTKCGYKCNLKIKT